MSKLYIPTSTLNFNNIMASESISPARFYPVRGFGYRRFDKVEPNNLDNRIILYEKFPVFNINDKELENYPFVIEIETKTIGEDIIKVYKDGVYYSEETIYFNPFSTQFIFNNETEKRSTLSKVEQSLNTKMVAIYQNRIIVKTPNIESFKWDSIDLADSKSDFSNHISKDRKINKQKGFLYAYLLGANKSLPSKIVALRKYAKELENVLSAIITSPDNRASYQQEEQLKKLYQSIYNAFLEADEKLQSIIKQKVEQYRCENFIDILRVEGVLDNWYQKQNIKPQFQIKQFYISYSSTPDDKQKAFDVYISDLANAINKIAVPRNMKVDDLPILQNGSRVESVQNNNFLPKLFNEFLAENWNSEEFISGRLDFATAGGKLFKEELQDKWDKSTSKNYINDLRNNLASHTSFSLQNTDNLTLKSFGAFCQKGEDDIDKLEDYLISNEIGDFRIAFALWGIVFGFANMPKTLTNDLFLSSDLDYVSNIYKFIFKQVHGIELDGSLNQYPIKKQPIEKVIDTTTTNQTTKKAEQTIKTLSDSQEIRIKLKDCNLKPEQLDSISEIYEKNRFIINEKLFTSIKKIRGIGNKAIEKIKEALGREESEISKSTRLETSLFEEMKPELGKEFYNDSSTFYHIEILIPQKLKKKFKTDLDWFQSEYMKGTSSQYYAKALRDNDAVIVSFERYIGKKEYAEQLKIDSILGKLKELYLI